MSTDELITTSLASACGPRPSVFGHGRSDTVAEIADLPKLDARAFFAETHVTEGMAVLLRQVFERLMGRSDQGVFRLKQAMGGGKTHNLLAAALLAREPAERKSVLQQIGVTIDDRPIRVAAFSGRETDTSDYLWVTLFRALGCEIGGSARTKFQALRPGQRSSATSRRSSFWMSCPRSSSAWARSPPDRLPPRPIGWPWRSPT